MTVNDNKVTSLGVYSSTLFVGTEPEGGIYVLNSDTDKSRLLVITGDHKVSCMELYDGRLWAGTSPRGYIYSFDGTTWRQEQRMYGRGISCMAATDEKLFVFAEGAETGVCWDGESWETIGESMAAWSHASPSPSGTPLSPEHNILAVDNDGSSILFGGQNGEVLKKDDDITRLFQTDSGETTAISNIGSGMTLAAIGNKVYLIDENE